MLMRMGPHFPSLESSQMDPNAAAVSWLCPSDLWLYQDGCRLGGCYQRTNGRKMIKPGREAYLLQIRLELPKVGRHLSLG